MSSKKRSLPCRKRQRYASCRALVDGAMCFSLLATLYRWASVRDALRVVQSGLARDHPWSTPGRGGIMRPARARESSGRDVGVEGKQDDGLGRVCICTYPMSLTQGQRTLFVRIMASATARDALEDIFCTHRWLAVNGRQGITVTSTHRPPAAMELLFPLSTILLARDDGLNGGWAAWDDARDN